MAQGHDLGPFLGDIALGEFEGGAVGVVEALGHVAGQLQVLGLVLAHRDQVRIVDQDVCRHQGRVGEQAAVDVVGVLGAFVFELGHAAQLAELGVAAQDPVQLGVGRDMALDKEDALGRVDAGGQQHGRGLAGVAAEGCGLLPDGQGVEVGHHIQAVELILQLGPVADRPNVVAQSKGAGGLDAGQNDALALALLTHKNASLCIDADRISRQEAGGPNRPAAEKNAPDKAGPAGLVKDE